MKPKLLFLCQTLPYPPDAGVNIRSYNVLRLLARHFDVTAFCFFRALKRPSPELVGESVRALNQLAHVEAFPIPQESSRARYVWDHVRSLVSGRPYTYYAYDSRPFRRRLRALLTEEQYEAVHVDSLDLVRYLAILDGLPIYCTHHNVESSLLSRRANVQVSRLRRFYLRLQAWLTARAERYWVPRVHLNIMVSAVDRDELRRLAPDASFTVVPNGVDVDYFHRRSGESAGVVFVGSHGWLPNLDAMNHFGRDILPLVRELCGPVEVTWVGRAPQDEIARFQRDYGIRLTGYVDDIRPIVAAAACYIVPIRFGGGTRLKILDAWAMGMPVVSTTVGCEGLEAVDSHNILIADSPADFARAVQKVLADSRLRDRLGANARDTVERLYDWEVVGRTLADAYVSARQKLPAVMA